MIGKVDSKRLCAQLSDFIGEVARVKALVTGNGSGRPHTPGKERGVGFAPEFSGTKRQYAHTTAVESRCDHGTIVNELARQLADRGLRIGNDKYRDLFTVGRNGRVNVLFEVKTDCSTSSIYEAVGQLMFHGAGPEGPPSRVIVLPEMPKRETVAILSRIGISVVVFAIAGETVRFRKLDDALSG